MATKSKRGGHRPGAGAKKTKTAAERMVVGSIRMKPEHWRLFEKWGGAPKLRTLMDKVKGGEQRQAPK